MKYLVRCLKTKSFSRSVVQPFFGLSNFGIAERFKVGALGKILAQQSVGVFVESPFPGTIRMGKIHVGLQGFAHLLMLGKFVAIVHHSAPGCHDTVRG